MNSGQLTAADLYKTIDIDKLGKIPGKLNKNTLKLRKYLGKIYMELMEYVIDDIIENNVTFKLTLILDRKGTFHIRPIKGDDFKRLMQSGSFKGLDFLKTDFTGYRLFYSSSYRNKDRSVALDKRNKNRIIDKANSGMKYF